MIHLADILSKIETPFLISIEEQTEQIVTSIDNIEVKLSQYNLHRITINNNSIVVSLTKKVSSPNLEDLGYSFEAGM